ncbi:MAG: hypothetical protein LBU11_12380 [Zoogloeaceae bacterium]|jgi:uncharacterized membrane protein YjjP (DUF1212 family)|nr:hypothetical protein [Zoogloeaceae bacterium]
MHTFKTALRWLKAALKRFQTALSQLGWKRLAALAAAGFLGGCLLTLIAAFHFAAAFVASFAIGATLAEVVGRVCENATA